MKRRVVLIGIDGFDPGLVERLLRKSELPAFQRVMEKGGWSRLRTTNPALSPTAWSTMATGCNPGYHGLFDFIRREIGSYIPKLAVLHSNPRNLFGNPRFAYLPARSGEPFWTLTSAQKVPTSIIKWPVTFPPEVVSGHMLSGLGVPDVRGTSGRYTLYSTALPTGPEKLRGDVVQVSFRDSQIETIVIGPEGVTVPMIIRRPSADRVTVEIQNKVVPMEIHQWSAWIPVTFHRFGFPKIRGIFRMHLDSLEPAIRFYASAIHMDPRASPFPISAPETYAGELAADLGAFHTLGLPEETNGLVDGVLSEEAFLAHAEDLFREREALFEYEWHRFGEGIFAFVFDTLDRVQHTMWSDPSGGAEQDPPAAKRMGIVEEHYRKLDRVMGRMMDGLGENDFLMVVSDHGFSTFDKALNVNSWLRDQGLLVLKEGPEGLPLFENVDWKKTKVYAMGFVSVYLNLQGREPDGMVLQNESSAVKKELTTALLSWKDPLNGEKVLHGIYDNRTLYRGPLIDQSPDLVLAPRAGYRVSWQTGYGAAPAQSVVKNDRAWRADHIVDPSLVPGVLFSNQPLDFSHPSVSDIAPTVLRALGIPPGQKMEGRSLEQ